MFCKKCGKELSENAFICPDCGEPTNSLQSPSNSLQAEPVNKPAQNGIAIVGFTSSLVSVACWICYLATVLCGYSYLGLMVSILGVVTGIVCFTGIVASVYAFTKVSNGKERAFAITGIVLSAVFFVGFLLLTCIVGCM